MGKKLDKFLLLMWKNFLLQWRHPKQTIVEILAPVLFSLLLVVLRSLVSPIPHSAIFYMPYQGVLPFLYGFPITITWSPSNPKLFDIMNETVSILNERWGYDIIQHQGFNNSQELDKYLTSQMNLGSIIGGVQFDDSLFGDVELTSNITITLRFPGELRNGGGIKGSGQNTWKTNLLFPIYQTGGPRTWDSNVGGQPKYQFEGFLYLQQEISLSVINYFKQKIHGKFLNRTEIPIFMQRFPYPKWMEDFLLQALQSFLGLIIMLSFVYTCISTVKVITTEKERQLKEAMKIMGLPNWLHWTAWFVKSFIFLVITIGIMVVLMTANWYPDTEYTIFTYSDPSVIFVFLMLYACATITFCFAVSVFFSKANTAATIAGITWFLSFFPYTFMSSQYDTLSLVQKLLSCLMSNTTMAYGFQLILMFEGVEEGLHWGNVWRTITPDDNLVFGHIMIMLAVDSVVYLLITLYVEAVFPGEYGVPQVWYYPFTSSYWCGKPRYIVFISELEECIKPPNNQNEFFEKEPTHLLAGIKIQNLHKEFKKKVAVEDLSLNIYKDQITVLLGHNGAGKTTTMSMLTGMFPPTSGTATVEGYDLCKNMAEVRANLGLCPQHNILFDELTVKEHLYFYSRLKGHEKRKTEEEVKKYVELLQLVPKANSPSSTLSGGMKRKLSVAVALCGDSKVVLCDEPTAGMDPSARRALWDLLQSQKKGRTILLTTHFMDEADLLGDRIAIMAGGKLQCCGSSYFLKKTYGAGYHLILDKSPDCNVNEVTSLVQKYIPGIQVDNNVGSELTYILSEDQSAIFEEMLGELESNSGELGILSYGISLTTLEEIYMKAGANHDHDTDKNGLLMDRTNDGSINFNELNHNSLEKLNLEEGPLKGWALFCNQFQAMFKKRILSIIRSWILFLIQNCIPVLFLVIAIVIIRNTNTYRDLPKLKIDLDSYVNTVTVVTSNSSNKYAQKYMNFLQKNNKAFVDWKNGNMTMQMLDETERNTAQVRQRYIIGATFENSITGWYNNNPYHSAPLTLKMIMNAVFQAEVSSDYSIDIYNHPLPFTVDTKLTDLTRVSNMGFQIAFNLGFSMAFVSSFYIMFYIRERITKAKHLQFVSGVGVIPFWGAAFLCDLLTFIFTSLLVIITLVGFQEDGFKTSGELGRVFSVLLYFGFSMLPMMYLASYLFEIPSTGYTRMALINIFTGVAAFIILQILSQPELNQQNIANTLHWILLLVPHYSLSTGIKNIHLIYSTHKMCDIFVENCINSWTTQEECALLLCEKQEQCCTMTKDYYDWESPGIGSNVLFSYCVGLFLIGILLSIEYRLFHKIAYIIQQYLIRAPSTPSSHFEEEEEEDSDVQLEKQRVHNASPKELSNYDFVMKDVTKYYGSFLGVNKICLAANKYECFGLLGVNGAGKTSTFKMMTGDIPLSSGEAWVNGLNIKTNLRDIYQIIGYCPQFDALLDDLTCKETITIFSLLRGIPRAESKLLAEDLAHQFDFHQHLNKKVKELSGGNKRKLSTAVAMIGDPLILYLDEPTTGMDPATKRYLWNALCKLRDSGKCIILTSHSMEECEALCTRLAIMVNGVFKCLGSTQHLKSKFSEGYTLTIKVKRAEELQAIEEFVKEHFDGAIIREKHQELITFYISNKVQSWAKMFGIMERAKNDLNIEDYSLGQCNLEQVFLSFTKYQREE